MELDSFLATPRWEILQMINKRPSAPTEIAENLGTTISFVSQQLKLLEAAGLVKKERTGAVEKGKPRTIFSISREMVYLVPLVKGVYQKKLLELTKEHKIVIKIWQIEDHKLHAPLEKFFWRIDHLLEDIDAIFVYHKGLAPKIYLLSKKSNLTQKINKAQETLAEKLSFQVISSVSPLSKLEKDYLVPIHGSSNFLEEPNELKGGNE